VKFDVVNSATYFTGPKTQQTQSSPPSFSASVARPAFTGMILLADRQLKQSPYLSPFSPMPISLSHFESYSI
jgi:hypothetical protein